MVNFRNVWKLVIVSWMTENRDPNFRKGACPQIFSCLRSSDLALPYWSIYLSMPAMAFLKAVLVCMTDWLAVLFLVGYVPFVPGLSGQRSLRASERKTLCNTHMKCRLPSHWYTFLNMFSHIVPFVGLSLCIVKFLLEWRIRNLDSEINYVKCLARRKARR